MGHFSQAWQSSAASRSSCTPPSDDECSIQRVTAAVGTPRGGVRLFYLAAAAAAATVLVSSLPTASGTGAGLGSTASAAARARTIGAVAERRRNAGRPADAVEAGVHEDPQSKRTSSLPRRRRHSRTGEEEGGHSGGSDGASRRSSRYSSRHQMQKGTPPSPLGVHNGGSSSSGDGDEDGSTYWGGSSSDGGQSQEADIDYDSGSSSRENYDTDENLRAESTSEDGEEEGFLEAAEGGNGSRRPAGGRRRPPTSGEDYAYNSDKQPDDSGYGESYDEGEFEDGSGLHHPQPLERGSDAGGSVEVCVVTWNLAEESPPLRDLEFLRHASRGSDLVAVGVQEIENLKPRRHEGGRTREWRRLLIRTLGRDFIRVGHHAMGAVQLTLFARREMLDRVKVIKLSEVVCGVGNVLQNKGGIGAYVRVDRTTFLFVAAHLAAHQGKVDERNAGYWRIASALNEEIPPAWVTHAARKRAKRAKAAAAAAAAAAREGSSSAKGREQRPPPAAVPWLPGGVRRQLPPRGPFGDRVDRVFFFGDLNYRVDLSREDLELGVSVCRRHLEAGTEADENGERAGEGSGEWRGRRIGRRFEPGDTYPGVGALDALLDFDQLSRVRSRGAAFGGFSEARVKFEPTYKYDKGSQSFDTSRKMRPPAWTDRILFAPPGPHAVSPLKYTSVPNSCHSDHRPVYAKFRVRLDD